MRRCAAATTQNWTLELPLSRISCGSGDIHTQGYRLDRSLARSTRWKPDQRQGWILEDAIFSALLLNPLTKFHYIVTGNIIRHQLNFLEDPCFLLGNFQRCQGAPSGFRPAPCGRPFRRTSPAWALRLWPLRFRDVRWYDVGYTWIIWISDVSG